MEPGGNIRQEGDHVWSSLIELLDLDALYAALAKYLIEKRLQASQLRCILKPPSGATFWCATYRIALHLDEAGPGLRIWRRDRGHVVAIGGGDVLG